MSNQDNLALADEVWHRVVQIVQEAMLMGVDCADLLRQVRVSVGSDGALVLTPEYKKMVASHHQKWLDEAVAKQAELDSSKIVSS